MIILLKRRLPFLLAALWLLAGCDKLAGVEEKTQTPVEVFNEACEVLDQRYALFPVKQINWAEECNNRRATVGNGLTDNQFFKLLGDHLQVLTDGHVSLIRTTDTATYTGFYSQYRANFNFQNVVRTYLENSYQRSGPFIYKVKDSVGYLYYGSFSDSFSEDNLERAFSTLGKAKGIIVDVRNNTGGAYSNVEKLYARFIKTRTLVKYERSKKGAGHNDFFDPESYYVNPASPIFDRKICVLTNRKCFSACNDFVSFMSDLPNVVTVGDRTGGGGGIPFRYVLRNGWVLQFTATMTLSAAQIPIESGLAPDVLAEIRPIDETNGQDPIVDKAISLLR